MAPKGTKQKTTTGMGRMATVVRISTTNTFRDTLVTIIRMAQVKVSQAGHQVSALRSVWVDLCVTSASHVWTRNVIMVCVDMSVTNVLHVRLGRAMNVHRVTSYFDRLCVLPVHPLLHL